MHILVTGGAGYIGSTLVPMLLDRGHHVKVLDSLRFGVESLFPAFACPRFELVRADVRNQLDVWDSVKKADSIVHLAAIVGYPACKQEPDLATAVNVGGVKTINQVRSESQRVIFASTGSVYGDHAGEVCSEDTACAPETVYGQTKLEGERIFLDKGNAIVYRFATAFGLSPRLRLDLLPNDFTYKAVVDKNLILYQPHAMRTFLHVKDIARAIVHALEHEFDGGIYNCGGHNCSKLDIAEMLQRYADFYLAVNGNGVDPDKRDYQVFYQKLYATGYQPCINLEDGIAEMAKAFRHFRIRNPYGNV